ncbi:unnamed protein product [Clavelina lepadiformis]|uniref:Uncharacterized protein n=1 Tax=Clavelina lepadiformis TaxID=159417 RepID=A0ABP0G6P5_CLALP
MSRVVHCQCDMFEHTLREMLKRSPKRHRPIHQPIKMTSACHRVREVVSLFLGSGLPATTSRLGESGGKEIAPKSAGNELISVVDKGALGYSAETRLPLNPTVLALSPPCA